MCRIKRVPSGIKHGLVTWEQITTSFVGRRRLLFRGRNADVILPSCRIRADNVRVNELSGGSSFTTPLSKRLGEVPLRQANATECPHQVVPQRPPIFYGALPNGGNNVIVATAISAPTAKHFVCGCNRNACAELLNCRPPGFAWRFENCCMLAFSSQPYLWLSKI